MIGPAIDSDRSRAAAGRVTSLLVVGILLLGSGGVVFSDHTASAQFVSVGDETPARSLFGDAGVSGTRGPADSVSTVGTICLATGTLLTSGQQCPVQSADPTQIAWDAANGDLYAAAQNGSVFVISPATDTVIATPSGAEFADGVAVDPSNGDVYVAGFTVVSVISGTTNAVVTGVGVGDVATGGIAFDPANGDLYVLVPGDGQVAIIDGATNTLVSNISVGGAPWGAVYDSWNGDMYITGTSGGIVVVNGTTNTVVARISGVGGSNGGAFDPSNGYVYIPDDTQDTLNVINGSTNTVVAKIGIHTGNTVQYDPVLAGFDPDTGDICVPDFFQDDVAVVAGPSNTVLLGIPTGAESWGVAFDPGNGNGYVTNFGNDTVSIISPPDTIPITFSETGLPVGTSWTVTTDGSVGSALYVYYLEQTSGSTQITTFEPNGTMYFRVSSGTYLAAPSSGSINVTGAPQVKVVAFSPPPGTGASGGNPGSDWSIIGGVAVVVGVVAGLVYLVLRRRRFGG